MTKTRLIGLAAVLLAGACSSPTDNADDQVASFSSAPPVATANSDSKRPQLRLDTSAEEFERVWRTYEDCLVGHGVRVNPTDQAGPAGNVRRLDQSGEPKQAYAACADKLPRQPPELDEDKNPNYAAQWNDNVRCLRAHGLKVHVTKPGEWGYDDDASQVLPNQAEIEESCLREAFSGKK
jgi:hypothetical protein